MNIVRIGVIGTGVMGARHARVYSNLRHVDLIGVADLDTNRGKNVANTYDTHFFEDYRSLLKEVDAVSIVTPTPAHFSLAMEALEYDTHILVEKPLTKTIEEARQLVSKAKQQNKILQVGHIERFNPAFIELRNVTQRLKLIAINVRRLSPFDTSNTDVDVIQDLMIHDLDLVVNLMGKNLEGLNAWGRSISTEAIDHAVTNLSFRNGPIATLFASRITEQKVRSIEITAEGAYIEADLLGKNLLIHRRTFPHFDSAAYRQESIIERIHVPMVEPLRLELEHFIECIQENKLPSVPGEDGLYALQLAQAVIEQIQNLMILGDISPVFEYA